MFACAEVGDRATVAAPRWRDRRVFVIAARDHRAAAPRNNLEVEAAVANRLDQHACAVGGCRYRHRSTRSDRRRDCLYSIRAPTREHQDEHDHELQCVVQGLLRYSAPSLTGGASMLLCGACR